ncbi:MAG: hypothetical protein DHS20C18_50150 [Saprospiraceae bacterium]|nr:MAG: hypothetical protein DHS20C18_50150 [Saprospiraceae bacterium]
MKNPTIHLLYTILLLISNNLCSQSYAIDSLNHRGINTNNALLQDYDNDGDLDLIVSQRDPDGIYWIENEPSQQYPLHPIYIQNISRITDLDMADIDNDGLMDYVISTDNSPGSSIDAELIWIQRQGNGNYIKWTIDTGARFLTTRVGDLNGDGLPDIVVARPNTTTDGTIKIFINNGNFFFTTNEIEVPGVRHPIDIGDLDGDGDIDIVVGGIGGSSNNTGSRTLINDGNGQFSFGTFLACLNDNVFDCGSWESIKIADLNGDGAPDILGVSSNGLGPGLYFLDGANGYDQTYLDHGLGDTYVVGDFVVADIDGNGLNDIVAQSELEAVVYVLYQTQNLVFERQPIDLDWHIGGSNGNANMTIGDWDDDGDLDIIFPEQSNLDKDLSWFENIGGTLYKHNILGLIKGVQIPKFGDFDNDGDLDIFATASENILPENEVILLENNGNNQYTYWRLHDDMHYAFDIELSEIDGDGDIDAFVTARDANDLVWLRNDGFPANWIADTIDANTNQPLGIIAGDIDLDNDNDVALCSFGDGKVFWYQNDGFGHFTKMIIDANLPGCLELEMHDLDNDNDMDFVVISEEEGLAVSLQINNGNNTFTRQVISAGKRPTDIEIGDWNDDGLVDVIVSFYSNTISSGTDVLFLQNNGNMVFEAFPIVEMQERATALKLIDIDGDTDLDLIVGIDVLTGSAPSIIAVINEQGAPPSIMPLADYTTRRITGIEAGDLDLDGIIEIVFADNFKDNLLLLSNKCTAMLSIDLGEDITATIGELIPLVPMVVGENLSYEWSTGATDSMITVDLAGVYSLTITDENGCTATDQIEVTLLTSVKNTFNKEQVIIQPNPTVGLFEIYLSPDLEFPLSLSIFDISGKKQFEQFIQNPSNSPKQIDLSLCPSGNYWLSVKNSNHVIMRKVLKF